MFPASCLLVLSFLNCYKKLMFKKWNKQTKTHKAQYQNVRRDEEPRASQAKFFSASQLQNSKETKWQFWMIVLEKKKSSSSSRPSLPSQIKNSLLCSPLKKESVDSCHYFSPTVCLLGRPLPPFLHESNWSNPAEARTRCRYRIVDEVSVAVITMVQIKGEKK